MAKAGAVTRLDEARQARENRQVDAYVQGRLDERIFVDQRITDLLALSPEQRALYFMLADEGFGDGLPPIVVKLLRGEVRLWT